MPPSLPLFIVSTLSISHNTMDTYSPQHTVLVPEENMDTARTILKVLHEVENLKRLPRAGWRLKNIQEAESVAEHSYRLGIMTFFAPVRRLSS